MGKNDDIIAIDPNEFGHVFTQVDWTYDIVMRLDDAIRNVDDAVYEIDTASRVIHNTLELYTWDNDDKYRKAKLLDAVLDDVKKALTDMLYILDDLHKMSE